MLGEGFADGGFVQELRLVDQASHQCRGTNLVDAARQTYGLFEDASHGIPRRINQICTAALIAGAVAKAKVIDNTPVRRAINDLERQ